MILSFPSLVRRYTLTLLALWSLLCLGAFFVARTESRLGARRYALEAARESLQKDLVYRHWNASHGGVYVLVTPTTPPNPYLAGVPARDLTAADGRRLTLVNPAYMTRQVHELGQQLYGTSAHITSRKPLRPENAPDGWEMQALQRFEAGDAAADEVLTIDGEPYLRAMTPLKTEESCLKCHAAQGYKLGELRGGLSVTIPLQAYLVGAAADVRRHALLLFGLWGSGAAIIVFGGLLLGRHVRREDAARTALAHSERRYRQLFDSIDGAFLLGEIVCDPAGRPVDYRILAVNAAFVAMSGLNAVEVVDRQASGVPVPEEWWWLDRYGKVSRSGEVEHFYHFSQRLEKHLGIRVFSPEPGQFAVLTSDITERMTAELKVNECRQRFQELVDSTDGMVWELDLESLCFTFVSQRAVTLLGYPLDAWYQPDFWQDHLHPDDRFWAMHFFAEQIERRQNHEFEYRMRAADGRYIWVRDLVSVRVVDGRPKSLSGVLIDVTAARAAAEKLEEYRLAVEASQDMICAIDRDYRYVLANQSFLAMRGVERDAVIGQTVLEVFGPQVFATVESRLRQAFAGEVVVYDMQRDFGAKGVRDLSIVYAPVSDKGEVARVVAVIRDVTANKVAERALVAATATAMAANRAKTEFLANMSHELRTPLNGVLGMLQLLASTELAEEQRDYVDIASRSGWGLLEILNDLLDLTRIEAGRMGINLAPFELAAALQNIGELFAVHVAEKHIAYRLDLDPALPVTVIGDEARLRQILFNLVGNAVKFTPAGGSIDLSVKGGGQMAGKRSVTFAVADSGIGIETGVLETICNPFVQGENVYRKRYQGVGLGLAIVKRLVEAMDGSIKIESRPGVGTVVQLSLPMLPAAGEVRAPI